ncbi:MAG: hypothetical protein Kilf2KO_47600 [Rhodospirillales bacterium]
MDVSFEAIAPLRFGYGRRPGEPETPTPESLLAQVPEGTGQQPGFGREGTAERLRRFHDLIVTFREARKAKDKQALEAARAARSAYLFNTYARDAHARVLWSVSQPLGFFERLAFFWADHFTVSTQKQVIRHLAGCFEAEAIRPNIAGDFVTLLRRASLHPAMLIYLDQNRSVGPGSTVGKRGERGLNENLAREIMELHSLGVDGGYDQADVRQFAELLTGVTIDRPKGRRVFDERQAEPGSKELLGQVYGAEVHDMPAVHQALEDLARHPATARHIARKLAVHFLSDDPPEEVVEHLTATYQNNDTQLMPVYRALLEHPAAWETYGQKIRQPFDLIVTSLRIALPPGEEADFTAPRTEADEDEAMMAGNAMAGNAMAGGGMQSVLKPRNFRWTLLPLNRFSQLPWSAPGPDGWPEAAEAWISPQGLTERLAFATRLAKGPFRRTSAKRVMRAAFGEEGSDRLALLALEARGAEARTLILASPEFQRR